GRRNQGRQPLGARFRLPVPEPADAAGFDRTLALELPVRTSPARPAPFRLRVRAAAIAGLIAVDLPAAAQQVCVDRGVQAGHRLALSFDREPAQATLLVQSLSMPTSDVSLMFDMTFAGLTDAYKADLAVHWSEVHKSKSFSAGATIYFVSADIDLALDELRR